MVPTLQPTLRPSPRIILFVLIGIIVFILFVIILEYVFNIDLCEILNEFDCDVLSTPKPTRRPTTIDSIDIDSGLLSEAEIEAEEVEREPIGVIGTPATDFIGIIGIIVEREREREREEEVEAVAISIGIGFVNCFDSSFDNDLFEYGAEPAPQPNIIDRIFERERVRGFEIGAAAPTVTVGIGLNNGLDNCFVNGFNNDMFGYGSEYGFAYLFVVPQGTVDTVNIINNGLEREREIGFECCAVALVVAIGFVYGYVYGCDNGLFECEFVNPHGEVFFTTIIFDTMFTELTVTVVTVGSERKSEKRKRKSG